LPTTRVGDAEDRGDVRVTEDPKIGCSAPIIAL
jgi:hypothetical protein